MLEKSSFSKRSSLPERGVPERDAIDLDQTRVSSMADEGGTAGASMDAREQGEAIEIEITPARAWSWLAVGLVAGCAALAGALLAVARTRSSGLGLRRRRGWLWG